jgi:hypothetical protein
MTGTITVEAAAGGGRFEGHTPPSDTDPAIPPATDGALGALLAMAGAGLIAFVLARRRFARD